MSRRYRLGGIEVITAPSGEPAEFCWRGRRYVVRSVVATWVEAVPWWAGEAPVPGASGQRQLWRVEAAPRAGSTGVYDLFCTQGLLRGRHQAYWGMDRVID